MKTLWLLLLLTFPVYTAEKDQPHHVRKVTLTLSTESNSPDNKTDQESKKSYCDCINKLDPKIKTAIISGISSIVTALVTWLGTSQSCKGS